MVGLLCLCGPPTKVQGQVLGPSTLISSSLRAALRPGDLPCDQAPGTSVCVIARGEGSREPSQGLAKV